MQIKDIATAAQLAILLEVSAPKPGNVTCGKDFEDTRYEHFLASAAAFAPVAREAAQRGYSAARGRLPIEKIGIGRLIKKAVIEAKHWHHGGNTILGEAMLLLPLCAGAGHALARDEEVKLGALRKCALSVVKAATYKDTIELYKGIKAASPRLLSAESLDVFDPRSLAEIAEHRITFYQVMRMSEGDSIARELVQGYPVTFELGYPALKRAYESSGDLQRATVECFLSILSAVPDSLIVKKAGKRVAEEVSERARRVLEAGVTEQALEELDEYLRSEGNLLNPGTTADLVASSLFVGLVSGIRP